MIKKAILPVAGLGTRFLPASKSIPKEMVTVIDRPAIEYVVREAVAAGMVLAAELSAMLGQLDPQGVTRLRQLNQSAGLPILAPDLGPAHWLSLMRHDKKVSQGRLRLILLRGIGQAYIEENVNESILNQLLSGNCILPSSH